MKASIGPLSAPQRSPTTRPSFADLLAFKRLTCQTVSLRRRTSQAPCFSHRARRALLVRHRLAVRPEFLQTLPMASVLAKLAPRPALAAPKRWSRVALMATTTQNIRPVVSQPALYPSCTLKKVRQLWRRKSSYTRCRVVTACSCEASCVRRA